MIVQVYPLLWLFLTSFRTASISPEATLRLPVGVHARQLRARILHGNLWLNIVNSLIVTLGASALIVIAGMMAAYALQGAGLPLQQPRAGAVPAGIIVPVQIAPRAPVHRLRAGRSAGHPPVDDRAARRFLAADGDYLFSSFYEYIPREMYEAASLDGAGPYRIFGQITFPLSANTIITVVLVNSIFIWNDFIFANTFVLSDGLKTIPLGLQNYIGAMGNTDWTATFAAVCVTVTPLLLVFLVLNKAMINGLESGATKG